MDFGVFQIVPTDFIILLVVWVVLAIVALQGGRGEVISGVIGGFTGLVLYEYLLKAAWIGDFLQPIISNPRNAAILFVVLVVVSYLGIRQMMLPYGSDLIGSPTQSAVLGLLSTVALLAIWMVAPHTNTIWQFGSLFQNFFTESYTFFWVFGAFVMMAIFG